MDSSRRSRSIRRSILQQRTQKAMEVRRYETMRKERASRCHRRRRGKALKLKIELKKKREKQFTTSVWMHGGLLFTELSVSYAKIRMLVEISLIKCGVTYLRMR